MSSLSNSQKPKILLKIHNKTLEKRNTSECYKVLYTEKGVYDLMKFYETIHGLPQQVRNFTMLRPTYHTELCKRGLIEIFNYEEQNKDYDFKYYGMISPNPSYFSTNSNPLTEKDKEYGAGIIVWFFHQNQIESSNIKNKTNAELSELCKAIKNVEMSNSQLYISRTNSQDSISSIDENSHITYLASILNLETQHLNFLKDSKKRIFKYLELIFNVDLKNDFVNIYAHFPYMENMVTFHLHVRINQGLHPLEKHHSMTIDEMINILESGNTIRAYVIERGICYDELEAGTFLESLNSPGISLERIKNPFILQSSYVINPMLTYQWRRFKNYN